MTLAIEVRSARSLLMARMGSPMPDSPWVCCPQAPARHCPRQTDIRGPYKTSSSHLAKNSCARLPSHGFFEAVPFGPSDPAIQLFQPAYAQKLIRTDLP